MLRTPRSPGDGVGLVVTPNLDHIVNLRRNDAFVQAYHHAAIIVCDGFPVRYYANIRGIPVERVTGYDIVEEMMHGPIPAAHRLFFVVDSNMTSTAVRDWGRKHGVLLEADVPPLGFENTNYSKQLIDRIREHESTILIMGVGAPKSEIWVSRNKDSLPDCWAICVGEAVRATLGLTPRAPKPMRIFPGEWFWRLCHDPRRLAKRYLFGSVMFLVAIGEEWLDSRLQQLAWRRGYERGQPSGATKATQ
jgi:N-acetylglucosaminyldiphosphoundecaprenol N-acetyl-beta-D-mannosaminyltransferase